MIIKKPYAFLIKHFRLIHAILFGLLVFILAETFNIYSFFSSYAQTHLYVNTNNLADSYVSSLLIIATVLAIIVSFVIYYILSMKQKSNKVYLFERSSLFISNTTNLLASSPAFNSNGLNISPISLNIFE